jgi:hypothetical protein
LVNARIYLHVDLDFPNWFLVSLRRILAFTAQWLMDALFTSFLKGFRNLLEMARRLDMYLTKLIKYTAVLYLQYMFSWAQNYFGNVEEGTTVT